MDESEAKQPSAGAPGAKGEQPCERPRLMQDRPLARSLWDCDTVLSPWILRTRTTLHRESTASGPMTVDRSISVGDAWSLLNYTQLESTHRAFLWLSTLEEAHVRSWLGKRPQQRRFSGRFRLKGRHADHLGKTKNAYQSGGGNPASTRSSKLTPF